MNVGMEEGHKNDVGGGVFVPCLTSSASTSECMDMGAGLYGIVHDVAVLQWE